MIESVVALIISLAILAVVYVILKWVLGQFSLPAPLTTILNIVIGVVAIILVLRFLLTLI